MLGYEVKAYGINASYDKLHGNAGAANGLTSSGNYDRRVTVNGYWMFGGTKLGAGGERIRIHAPLVSMTKAEIVRRGAGLGVDYSLTFSCYDPDASGRPCGRCDACLLRAEGFRRAGLEPA